MSQESSQAVLREAYRSTSISMFDSLLRHNRSVIDGRSPHLGPEEVDFVAFMHTITSKIIRDVGGVAAVKEAIKNGTDCTERFSPRTLKILDTYAPSKPAR